jgi:alpha 1,2-mannosyltransferase
MISSKEYLFQILDLAYSYEPGFATDLVKPVKGEIRRHWENFMKLVQEKNFRYDKTVHGGGGRGIIFSAQSSLIEKALFNIDVLRQNGINLPVQVFWNGKLLKNSQLKMFEKREGVTLVEMNDFFPQMNRIDNHFLYKYIPLFTTNFDEVLFLDIDNFPISDPAPLFDLLAEKNVSALFWPDLLFLNPENPFWEELGGFPDNQFNFTQESGQIVLNREKCFWPLALSTFFNVKHKIYFKTAYIAKKPGEFMKGIGDKELFHIAWKAL